MFASVPAQVRLRQILLRVAAAGPPVTDPVRRKQVQLVLSKLCAADALEVKRSQEQAEAEMLDILQSLEADSMKSFQRLRLRYFCPAFFCDEVSIFRLRKVCRERSECQSALKGGELAGDMGWLDRVKGVGIQQDRAKQGEACSE